MIAIAKITAKGQTAIPAVIWARLQIGPGDLLAWEIVADGEVRVRRVSPLTCKTSGPLRTLSRNGWAKPLLDFTL